MSSGRWNGSRAVSSLFGRQTICICATDDHVGRYTAIVIARHENGLKMSDMYVLVVQRRNLVTFHVQKEVYVYAVHM